MLCTFQKLDKNSKISSIKSYDSSIVITVFVKIFENCSGPRNLIPAKISSLKVVEVKKETEEDIIEDGSEVYFVSFFVLLSAVNRNVWFKPTRGR